MGLLLYTVNVCECQYQQGYQQPGYPQQQGYPQQGYPQQGYPPQQQYGTFVLYGIVLSSLSKLLLSSLCL